MTVVGIDTHKDTLAALGHCGPISAQSRTRRGLRIDGVGLAAAAAHLTVRPHHLGHLDPDTAQMPAQPRPIRASALDPDSHQRPQAAQPLPQRPIARRVRPERRRAQQPPRLVHRRSDMNIFVSVDTPIDANRPSAMMNTCLSPR